MTMPRLPDGRARPDDFDALLDGLFAEELNEGEQRALEATIAADPAALARYVEAVHLRQSLPYLLQGESTPDDEGTQPVASRHSSQHADAAGVSQAASIEPDMRSEIDSARGGHQRASMLRGHVARRIPAWASAAGIAFVAGAALAAFVYRGVDAELAERQGARGVRPVTSASPSRFAHGDGLGKITGLSLEASADGLLQSMQVGQELRCGEVVQLSTGFIRIEFDAGPRFIVEGPAEFSLVAERSVFIRVGRIHATGRQRLVLQSPLVTAECDAAETTFVAEEDTSTTVYVHSGTAALATTPQEGVASEALRTLRDGEGLLVSPADNDRVVLTNTGAPANVVAKWEQVEARLSDYQRLVLGDKPLAYWPIHRVRRNRRVLDLSQHGFDGQPIGAWPTELSATAAEEPGAYFNGESYIEPDRKPPVNPREGFTIEGWANVAGGPEFQAVFSSRWVLRSHEPDCQMFGFTLYAGEEDKWQFWTGSGRRGELWQRLVSDAPVERSQWTHVVASFTPGEVETPEDVEGVVRLYVDGQQVVEGVHQVSLTDFEWPARIGAAEFVPRYLTSWLFKGRLRDVALYNYSLEGARVARHFQAGRSAATRESADGSRSRELLVASFLGGRGR
jgi:hypothetical protein